MPRFLGYHPGFSGYGGDLVGDSAVATVPALFLWRVQKTPDAEAFRYPMNGSGWMSLTWTQTRDRVAAIACGLRKMGLASEERCAIIASTRIEWVLADFGILCAGGATTTLFPTSKADECAFILSDSQSAFAFVENKEQLSKLQKHRAELPGLRKVILFDGVASDDGWATTLAQVEALGRDEHAADPSAFERAARAVKPDALATLMYTSGTTGRPKGVRLLHHSWVAQGAATDQAKLIDHPDPLQFFWLPLAHVFGKMIGTAQLQIGFPTAVDGRLERLLENLATIKPTFVCAVPRIFEKVYNRILQQAGTSPIKRSVLEWGLSVGRKRAQALREGMSPGPVVEAQWAIADRLLFRKIRDLFGGRIQFFVSGSAPLAREVNDLFSAAGVLIIEGYGLTESAAATHVNLPHRPRPGTVGPPLPGIEVRLAEDGEVLLRGAWIMSGYHGMEQETAEALEGGWLHTGDVGTIDDDGYLTITDRKKDLIKTAGGKYVAPQELEGKLKALCPLVSNVLVHGDRRTYVSSLVTIDPAAFDGWAKAHQLSGRPLADLVNHPDLRAEIQQAINTLNSSLPRFAQLRRFVILPNEFTEAAGELTASQKMKRKVVETRYKAAIDSMYVTPVRV